MGDRVSFEVATAQGFTGGGYDLVTMFDCLHDIGDPLGAQAGEAAIRQVATEAGFTRFRRAAQSPFNIVYEIRP